MRCSINFLQLKKNLKTKNVEGKPVKLAVLGNSSTQLLCTAIKGYGLELGLNLEIFEAEYDQIDQEVFNPESDLYQFNPDFILVVLSEKKGWKSFSKSELNSRKHFADSLIQQIRTWFTTVSSKLQATFLVTNLAEFDDSIFGSYATKIDVSYIYQIRKFNLRLMDLANEFKSLFIIDSSEIQNRLGRTQFFQSSLYVNSDMTFSLEALPHIAFKVVNLIKSSRGAVKKCLVLDLDNTVWGGVIGDDGIEQIQIGSLGIGKAFTEFQLWCKQLKERGIILAVSSKNEYLAAIEPFEKHKDMVLKLDDITVFRANWENKADNIKFIQEKLNIGLDSIVFLDDNPFERNLVRHHLPEITVPELPEDPAEYVEYVSSLNLFDVVSWSDEDRIRGEMYKSEMQRQDSETYFANQDEYLQSLDMKAIAHPFNEFTIPRVAQLCQRSNQFNLRTIRYTHAEIEQIANNENSFCLSLSDKFGDYGIIGVVILKKWSDSTAFIDTWIMSCRVLKRGVEELTINTMAELAIQNGFTELVGEYIPTQKNVMVRDLYKNEGFQQHEDGNWHLDLKNYEPKQNFIELLKKETK